MVWKAMVGERKYLLVDRIKTSQEVIYGKKLKEFIQILAQGEGKRGILEEIVREVERKVMEQLLEEMALVERETYCENADLSWG